jgi:hypothetical protein
MLTLLLLAIYSMGFFWVMGNLSEEEMVHRGKGAKAQEPARFEGSKREGVLHRE